jgi:glyoxylase-like metal-dependent hydrolase (beta-lactamase superfamily II)
MKIEQVVSGPFQTIGYLVSDETKEAMIIDTPIESTNSFMKSIRRDGLSLKAIVLSHTHWDHTADAAELRRQTGAKIFVHKDDKYRVVDPMKFTIYRLPFELEAFEPDVEFSGDEVLTIGKMNFEIIHTPGHTEGGICLSNREEKVLFAGDTLFNESIGRSDLPGGSMSLLVNSIIDKLLILPDDTKVYSGHGEPTTIGYERQNNPFLVI